MAKDFKFFFRTLTTAFFVISASKQRTCLVRRYPPDLCNPGVGSDQWALNSGNTDTTYAAAAVCTKACNCRLSGEMPDGDTRRRVCAIWGGPIQQPEYRMEPRRSLQQTSSARFTVVCEVECQTIIICCTHVSVSMGLRAARKGASFGRQRHRQTSSRKFGQIIVSVRLRVAVQIGVGIRANCPAAGRQFVDVSHPIMLPCKTCSRFREFLRMFVLVMVEMLSCR